MASVIEIDALTKRYRDRKRRTTLAVDGLGLEIPEGGVFGFMGPNGSGKTTTIRCMLGLVRPTSGSVRVLGKPVPEGFASVVARVGAVVEGAPSFPTMTGREQLRLLAATAGIARQRVDVVLEAVGLASRATDLVKRYSLGMRQRLALAAALLKDPELLVLDEPANGLDPAGMRDLRQLLRELGNEGRTVFVSSHLLGEIEQTCDSVAIVHRGKVVIAGPVESVLAEGDTASVLIGIRDHRAAKHVLVDAGLRVADAGALLRVEGAPPETVAAVLGRAELWVYSLERETRSLESRFFELTAETTMEVVA